MDKPVNIASLPRHETILRARVGGRSIFGDEGAVSAVYTDLLRHWIDANMPRAVGQTDDEFGELLLEAEKEFEAGVDEAIKRAKYKADEASDDARETVRQLSALLMLMSASFDGVENLPDPYPEALITLARDLAWKVEDHFSGDRNNG